MYSIDTLKSSQQSTNQSQLQHKPVFPSYFGAEKNPYILEIENETRKYVLAAKSHFDLEEWCRAIQAQIESLKSNRSLLRNQQSIMQIEQEIAHRDQWQVKNLKKLQMITSTQF
jgi:hypothetical protein